MKCEDFQEQYNRWLNGRMSIPLGDTAQSHMRECSACARYAKAIAGIDAALTDLPAVDVPEELLLFPDGPEEKRRLPRSAPAIPPLVFRGGVLTLPPVAAWLISASLPPQWQVVPQFILAVAGVLMFGLIALRPQFTD